MSTPQNLNNSENTSGTVVPGYANFPTGIVVAFEGADGIGKTSLLREVARMLLSRGIDCEIAISPGGTPLGQFARSVAHNGVQMSSRAITPMMLAAHIDLWDQRIEPAMVARKIVLMDRYTPISAAWYQWRDFEGALAKAVCDSISSLPGMLDTVPDIVFVLTADERTRQRRAASKRGPGPDRFEDADATVTDVAGRYAHMAWRVLEQPMMLRTVGHPVLTDTMDVQDLAASVIQTMLVAGQGTFGKLCVEARRWLQHLAVALRAEPQIFTCEIPRADQTGSDNDIVTHARDRSGVDAAAAGGGFAIGMRNSEHGGARVLLSTTSLKAVVDVLRRFRAQPGLDDWDKDLTEIRIGYWTRVEDEITAETLAVLSRTGVDKVDESADFDQRLEEILGMSVADA